MKYPFLFFDLDGTLTDPAQGICGSVRYALEKGGYPAEPLEAYHPWIGPPLLQSFENYLHVSEDEAKRLLGLYRERFSTIGLFENTVYPGIPELLSDLKSAGVRMAVATGKPTVFSERILEHFGLAQYFDLVSGISLNEAPLTKADVIRLAMEHFGISDRSLCAMIGDRFHDVEGAQMNGIDSIYVLYGYGNPSEAQKSCPTYIAKDIPALRGILFE